MCGLTSSSLCSSPDVKAAVAAADDDSDSDYERLSQSSPLAATEKKQLAPEAKTSPTAASPSPASPVTPKPAAAVDEDEGEIVSDIQFESASDNEDESPELPSAVSVAMRPLPVFPSQPASAQSVAPVSVSAVPVTPASASSVVSTTVAVPSSAPASSLASPSSPLAPLREHFTPLPGPACEEGKGSAPSAPQLSPELAPAAAAPEVDDKKLPPMSCPMAAGNWLLCCVLV